MIVNFKFSDGVLQNLHIASKNLEKIKKDHPDLEIIKNE